MISWRKTLSKFIASFDRTAEALVDDRYRPAIEGPRLVDGAGDPVLRMAPAPDGDGKVLEIWTGRGWEEAGPRGWDIADFMSGSDVPVSIADSLGIPAEDRCVH